jgi:hypothetical protein
MDARPDVDMPSAGSARKIIMQRRFPRMGIEAGEKDVIHVSFHNARIWLSVSQSCLFAGGQDGGALFSTA